MNNKNIIQDSILTAGRDINNGDVTNNYYQLTKPLSISEILDQIKTASHHLADYQNTFEKISNSHINRQETDELLDWIASTKPNASAIAMLVGSPGAGKSVILKDIWDTLTEQKIPVLGIKADRYYATSLSDLEKLLGLTDSLPAMLKKLSEEHPQIVVLIDQIDALSLSLSSSREYISTYRLLVKRLLPIKGIKVILSVRDYDLNYDTELNFIKKDEQRKHLRQQKKVVVDLLRAEEVKSVLERLIGNIKNVPPRLIELLGTPHHLNVFCRIYQSELKFDSIFNLHDLYRRLWAQEIKEVPEHSKANFAKLKSLLYAIATQMQEKQRINVPQIRFADKYHNEIQYLASQGLLRITNNNKKLEFFHQTFFDYIFAKQFVETEQSVVEYVLHSGQGLLVRSSLKMIINYLREYDEDVYIEVVQQLLTPTDVRFHIKHLLISLLGYLSQPIEEEIQLVRQCVMTEVELRMLFFEMAMGNFWLEWLIENGYLDELIDQDKAVVESLKAAFYPIDPKQNIELKQLHSVIIRDNRQIWYQMIRKQMPQQREVVLAYLQQIAQSDRADKAFYINQILYVLKVWDSDIAIELFESYFDADTDRVGFSKIVEDAAKDNLEWALSLLRRKIERTLKQFQPNDPNNKFRMEYREYGVLKRLAEDYPRELFWFNLEILKLIINKGKHKSSKRLYGDSGHLFCNVDSFKPSHDHQLFFSMLLKRVRVAAKGSNTEFSEFLKYHIDSDSETIVKIIIVGLTVHPIPYVDQIINLIKKLYEQDTLDINSKLSYLVRRLITAVYPLLTITQQVELNQIILGIKSRLEPYIYEDKNGRKRTDGSYGSLQFKYIQSIPTEYILKHREVNLRWLEFKRKFEKEIQDKEPASFRNMLRGVPAPFDKNAYDNMNFEQWEDSFIKYGADYQRDPFNETGSREQHARAFAKRVEFDPEKFYPFVKKLISKKKVIDEYIFYGLQGLSTSNISGKDFLPLYELFITSDAYSEYQFATVRMSDLLIRQQAISERVVDFLTEQALSPALVDTNHSDEYSYQDSYPVQCSAAVHLIRCSVREDFRSKVFTALQRIAKDASVEVRASVLPFVKDLVIYDEKVACDLFFQLVASGEFEVLRSGMWLADYYSKTHFEQLTDFFKKSMKCETTRVLSTQILASCWIEGQEGSQVLLEKALANNTKAQGALSEVGLCYAHTNNETQKTHRKKLFLRYKDSVQLDIFQGYEMAFHHADPKEFLAVYEWLLIYAASPNGQYAPSSYYEYLLKNSHTYPQQCIELLDLFIPVHIVEDDRFGRDDQYVIKALLGAYNNLDAQQEDDKPYITQAMQIFDRLLQTRRFRKYTSTAISQVEL